MTQLEIMIPIEKFIKGIDTTIEAANRLELMIDDSYPDDDFLQETVEILACYRPEGGEFLFDVQQVKSRLIETKFYLENNFQ